jgi:hypothetical protein
MDNFQTINQIINESIRSSSYITVVISSAVFISYTLIIKIVDYFKSKNRTKPLLEMANAIKENTQNIVKLNSVLDKTLKEAERKEIRQCEKAIDLSFKSFAFKLSQECTAIIAHNNIDENKDLVVGNITKLVETEYYKLYSSLSTYEINEINVATKLKEEWAKEVTDSLIHIVYNRQSPMIRITQINNRLNIYINEYSTFINNKVFNT